LSVSRRFLAKAALAAGLLRATPLAAQIAPDRSLSPGESASSVRELVARYLAWRGGPALEQLQTRHERLYLVTPDSRAPGQLWIDRDGRMRRQVDRAGAPEVEVATADGAWRLGADGQTVADPPAVERARRFAALEFGDAFRSRGGAMVSAGGRTELNDHPWSVIRIGFGDADVYDALIDTPTGALGGYVITEDGAQRSLMFGDWRMIDGVRMPFAQLIRAEPPSEVRVTAVELNRPLDPALFERPKGTG
jgi:hypothetical protein